MHAADTPSKIKSVTTIIEEENDFFDEFTTPLNSDASYNSCDTSGASASSDNPLHSQTNDEQSLADVRKNFLDPLKRILATPESERTPQDKAFLNNFQANPQPSNAQRLAYKHSLLFETP